MRHLIELSKTMPKIANSAYSYVVKKDPAFVISPGLIDLPNADALASTSATRRSRLLVKNGARSKEHTEHGAHGAHGVRSSRKTKILYNKIHCLLLQIFVIINKDFSRFTRWGTADIFCYPCQKIAKYSSFNVAGPLNICDERSEFSVYPSAK
jgi:hypothetical protein